MAAVAYGWMLNLWFWPTATGLPEALSFVPGAGPMTNVSHWFVFNMTTSLGYDLPRAALTCVAILLVGRRVLAALRRTSRIAAFDAAPVFDATPVAGEAVVVGAAPVVEAAPPAVAGPTFETIPLIDPEPSR